MNQDLIDPITKEPLLYYKDYYLNKNNNKYPIVNGIPCFVGPEFDPWFDHNLRRQELAESGVFDETTLIEQNYYQALSSKNVYYQPYNKWIQRILSNPGSILEIACGPGGSFIPLFLKNDSDRKLIVNDLEFWILEQWKKLLSNIHLDSNVLFLQFDACNTPLPSSSINLVNSHAGFSNIPNHMDALKEAFRYLRNKGKIFLAEGEIDISIYNKLPQKAKTQIEEKIGKENIEKGMIDKLKEVGFKITYSEIIREITLKPNESTIARIAGNFGKKMILREILIEAIKP